MQLMRRSESWGPFREFEQLSNRFSRLFGLARTGGNGERETLAMASWAPSCDITENDKEYCVKAELPNVKKDDVRVTLENGVLTIQGERREEKEENGERVHRRELSYGNFMRSFTMPEDADESKIDASFKDGMLKVVIGKSASKTPKAKQIAIH